MFPNILINTHTHTYVYIYVYYSCPKDACRGLHHSPSQAMECGASFNISGEEECFCSNSLKIEIAR
jgi:hypothetical protein